MKRFYFLPLLMALFTAGSLSAQVYVNSFPWTEDFESSNTCFASCTSFCPNIGDFTQDGLRDWVVDINGTTSFNTGPTANGGADHNPGIAGGKYIFCETSFPCSSGGPTNTWVAVSPYFDFTNTAGGYELSFYYHMFGTSMGQAHLDIDTTGNGTWVNDIIPQWTDNLDLWQNQTVNLTPYSGIDSVRFRIRYSGNTSFSGDMALDDFSVNFVLPNDAGISEILSPMNPFCGNDSQAVVVLTNFGADTLTSANVLHTVNGTAGTTLNWTGNLGNGETDTLTISTASITPGTELIVYTTMPNMVVDSATGNDTATFLGAAGLQGTYSLGASAGADFATFGEFVDSLDMVGACASIIVEIEDGTYTENVTLPEIPSLSASRTVTFRGENLNADLDTLTSATGNTIIMDGGDYFRFEHMTIENTGTFLAYTVLFNDGSNHNEFTECTITKNETFSTSTWQSLVYSANGTSNEFNTFKDNLFLNGSYGVYWYGSFNTLEEGNVFEGNEFKNQYYIGAQTYYQTNFEFEANSINSNSSLTFGYGLRAWYCDDSRFVGNHVYSDSTQWPRYGFDVYYSDASNFFNPGLVANNVVSVGDTANTFTWMYPMRISWSNIMSVVNNTVITRGGSPQSYCMYHYGVDFGRFQNNVMYNAAGGFAYYDNFSDELIKDNNVFYTTGTSLIFDANMTYNNLSEYGNATNQDTNSFNMDPLFNNWMTGTYCNDTLDNTGEPLMQVVDDFSGINRSSEPDPGAHEFFGLAGVALGPDTTLCQDEYILSIGDSALANSVAWTVDGTTYTTPTYVVQTSGVAETFTISASVSTDCGSATDGFDVTLVPNVSFADSMHICADETMVLDAQGGPTATYTWFPTAETTSTIDVSTPGLYTVTKLEEGCESSSTTTITQSDAVAISDLEPCNDNLPVVVNATISNGVSYDWSGGSSSTGASNDFDEDGDYAVSATDAFGCVSVDSFNVTIIDVPNAKIDEDHVGTHYFFNSDNSDDVGSNATYLWDFGDGGSSTLANPEHTYNWTNPSAPSQYQVTLLITNACGQDQDDEIISPDVLGVNDLNAKNSFTVYPNPSEGIINIAFENGVTDAADLRVLDLTGRVIATQTAQTSEISTIDLSTMAAGTYIIEVNLNGNISNSRVSIR